jgi:hypothetical protein
VNETDSFGPGAVKIVKFSDLGAPNGRYNVAVTGAVKAFGYAVPDGLTSDTVQPAVLSMHENGTSTYIDMVVIGASGSQMVYGTDCTYTNSQSAGGAANNAISGNLRIVFDSGDIDAKLRTLGVNAYTVPDNQTVPIDGTRTGHSANGTAISYNVPGQILAITGSITKIISTSNAFGQAYYNAIVQSGGTIEHLPMPIISWGDPGQYLNLTADKILAIYLEYLNQMKDRFKNYTYMGPDNVTLSGGSLDLLERGAIYDNHGHQLYDNSTVWTLYNSIADENLSLGRNVINQPGFILVWGHTNNLTGFTQSQADQSGYVPTALGYVVWIQQIYNKGNPINHTTLTITKVTTVIGNTSGTSGGSQITPPDLNWFLAKYWWALAGILGGVLLVGAVAIRNGMVGIVGLVLIGAAVAGWYFADHTVKLFGIFDVYHSFQNLLLMWSK